MWIEHKMVEINIPQVTTMMLKCVEKEALVG